MNMAAISQVDPSGLIILGWFGLVVAVVAWVAWLAIWDMLRGWWRAWRGR